MEQARLEGISVENFKKLLLADKKIVTIKNKRINGNGEDSILATQEIMTCVGWRKIKFNTTSK